MSRPRAPTTKKIYPFNFHKEYFFPWDFYKEKKILNLSNKRIFLAVNKHPTKQMETGGKYGLAAHES